MNVELSRDQLATRQHQERDKAELRDLLGNIIRNNDDMKTLLDMYSSPESPHPVVQVMESLQMVRLCTLRLENIPTSLHRNYNIPT